MYIEPTLYDFYDSIGDNYEKSYEHNNLFHLNKTIKINTIYNYLFLHHGINFYDFNYENIE
jgi:hypothetical protein